MFLFNREFFLFMEPITNCLYDIYASAVRKRISYCKSEKEVLDFYVNSLLPSVGVEKFSVSEFKKSLEKFKDSNLDLVIEKLESECDKQLNL